MKWPKSKAGELFEIQLGKMLNEKARTGDTFPYLANFNVRWGKFDLSELNRMAFSDREQEKFALQSNDLLMCEGGEIGRCAVWLENDSTIFYQKALHRLRPIDERVSSHFMYYYMHYLSTMGDLPKLVGETSIAHLTREKLVALPIPVPPRAIQNKIVELLLTWDAAIEKTEQLIAAKESIYSTFLTTLIHRSVKQKQWRQKHLVEIVTIRKGQQLNVADMIDDGKYYALNGGIRPSGRTDKWNTPENTITISEGGNSCGYVNFNPEKFWCGGHCYALAGISDLVDVRFLFHFLKSRQTRLMALRAGSGLPNIQKNGIESFAVNIAPLSEQQRIASVLDTVREEITYLENLVAAYKGQKRGLMQKLLTGQWRVKLPETEATQ